MKIKTDTIIRTIILALALANQLLTAAGKPVIPIEDETVVQLISTLATVGAAVWAWWKNNSITQAALKGDELMNSLKASGNK